MKFDTVGIHFLSDVFGLLSSRNFATLATWHNDFSYLLNTFHENNFPESDSCLQKMQGFVDSDG